MRELHLEGVKVLWPNFRGEPGEFNERGDRLFNILIDNLDEAEELLAKGWALKPLRNEEDEVDAYTLQLKVNYRRPRPPRVYNVNLDEQTKVLLSESTIEMLEYLPIDYVDVDINPYEWNVSGNSGVKAYVQAMYVVCKNTPLDDKYSSLRALGEED